MQKYDVGIVGLGYVGLTLATAMAEVGLTVIGVEKRAEVVEMTRSSIPHFSETGLEAALARVISSGKFAVYEELEPTFECNTYIITVGTPLGDDGGARLDMIEMASREVRDHMKDGALIILRSTVQIGTARKVVSRVLGESGKQFDIAMCPERTLEGRALQELRELPQIIGADTQEVRDRVSKLFRHLTASIVEVEPLETAEIIKLVDNTYRDTQFAFANEVARLCDAVGVNGYDVITSGKLGYTRTNVPLPGLVGGPCLEKDPHILAQSANLYGISMEITQSSRLVNERQPKETVGFITQEMEHRKLPKDAPISLLGMAFKGIPATDDLRGSMAKKVLKELQLARPDAPITLFDSVIDSDVLAKNFPNCSIAENLEETFDNTALIVIANNHPDFSNIVPAEMYTRMQENGFIYDYWNHFSKLSSAETGNSYYAVGNTKGA